MCMQDYRLDPLWYVSSPGMFRNAALLHSRVNLDLLGMVWHEGDNSYVLLLRHRHRPKPAVLK